MFFGRTFSLLSSELHQIYVVHLEVYVIRLEFKIQHNHDVHSHVNSSYSCICWFSLTFLFMLFILDLCFRILCSLFCVCWFVCFTFSFQ